MKMHLFRRGAMNPGFRFGQTGEYGARPGFDAIGKRAFPDDFENPGKPAVLVRLRIVVVMIMFVGMVLMGMMPVLVLVRMVMPLVMMVMLAVLMRVLVMMRFRFAPVVMMAPIRLAGIHIQVNRGDASADNALLPEFVTADRELRQFPAQVIERHSGVNERAKRHISGYSRYAVKVSDLHRYPQVLTSNI
jgi:hypothetical protein